MKNYEFWFVVGSQTLYGEEVLRTVAARAEEMAQKLSAVLPYPLKYKVTAKSNAEILDVVKEANYNDGLVPRRLAGEPHLGEILRLRPGLLHRRHQRVALLLLQNERRVVEDLACVKRFRQVRGAVPGIPVQIDPGTYHKQHAGGDQIAFPSLFHCHSSIMISFSRR